MQRQSSGSEGQFSLVFFSRTDYFLLRHWPHVFMNILSTLIKVIYFSASSARL